MKIKGVREMLKQNKLRTDWVISITNTEGSPCLIRAYGTKEEVKKYIVCLVKEDKEGDADNWDFGTETINDIYEERDELLAESVFNDYRINYHAKPFHLMDMF